MWFSQEAPARLTEATDDLGQSLAPEPGPDDVEPDGLHFATYSESGVAQASARFRLQLAERPGRVARLRGVVPVMLHVRRPGPTLVIPLADAAGKTFRCDDAEFTVREVTESPRGTTVTLTARLNVDHADLPDEPDPHLVTGRVGMMGTHQLSLVNAEGAVVADSIRSGSGGGSTPALYRWTLDSRDDGRATHLRYHGMLRVRAEVAFDFRDVPLP